MKGEKMIVKIGYYKENEDWFWNDELDEDELVTEEEWVEEKIEIPKEFEFWFKKKEEEFTMEDWGKHFKLMQWLSDFGDDFKVIEIVKE